MAKTPEEPTYGGLSTQEVREKLGKYGVALGGYPVLKNETPEESQAEDESLGCLLGLLNSLISSLTK